MNGNEKLLPLSTHVAPRGYGFPGFVFNRCPFCERGLAANVSYIAKSVPSTAAGMLARRSGDCRAMLLRGRQSLRPPTLNVRTRVAFDH
jgi:hypothetical protein